VDHGGKAGVGFVSSHGHSLELLQLTEEVLDQVPPFINVQVDVERCFALGALRKYSSGE